MKLDVGVKVADWTLVEKGRVDTLDDGSIRRYWLCKCACGRVREVLATSLVGKNPGSKCCGCVRRRQRSPDAVARGGALNPDAVYADLKRAILLRLAVSAAPALEIQQSVGCQSADRMSRKQKLFERIMDGLRDAREIYPVLADPDDVPNLRTTVWALRPKDPA